MHAPPAHPEIGDLLHAIVLHGSGTDPSRLLRLPVADQTWLLHDVATAARGDVCVKGALCNGAVERGLFVGDRILPKGKYILYGGEVITAQQAQAVKEQEQDTWMMSLSTLRTCIDGGPVARAYGYPRQADEVVAVADGQAWVTLAGLGPFVNHSSDMSRINCRLARKSLGPQRLFEVAHG